MPSLTRRVALKLFGLGTALFGLGKTTRTLPADDSAKTAKPVGRWNNTHNRVWLGEDFWANPMEDWRIVDGAAECQTASGDRNIHLVTHQITNSEGSFTMAVRAGQVEVRRRDGDAGFRIGVRSDLNEYRSNCVTVHGFRIDRALV